MKLLFLSIALMAACLSVSCGGDSSPAASSNSPPPASSPAPSPNNSPSGTSDNPAAIAEEFISDAVSPNDCQYPWKFKVRVDGSYTAGPCVSGGSVVSGQLTQEELIRLATMAEPVATSDLANSRECELFGAIGTDNFDITIQNGTTWRFLESNPQNICTRGGRAQAAALANYFHSLMQKYYPRR